MTLEHRYGNSPYDRAYSLDSKQHTHPVAGLLICSRTCIGSAPHGVGYRSVGISPHIKESRPTEKLHETDCPECAGCLAQQRQHPLFALLLLFGYAVIFCILARRHLADKYKTVYHTQHKHGRTYVERIGHTCRHLSLRREVAYAYGGESDGGEIAYQTAGIAQEALDGIGKSFLTLVYLVADKHLERLHGHIDGCVKKHQRDKSKYYCPLNFF